MLDGLASVCVADRVIFAEASERIAAGEDWSSYAGVTRAAAAQAMLDLRWAGTTVPRGQINEVLNAIRRAYIEGMARKIERMLRQWQRRGWLRDRLAQ